MALKKALLRDEKNKYILPPNLNDSYVKSQLNRGKPNTFRIKPSPLRVEKSTPDGRKTTRIKISFREGQLQSPRVHIKNPDQESKKDDSMGKNDSKSFKVNESLSNLRQDVSSMIEKSFGPFQDPEDQEIIVNEGSTLEDPDKF